MYGLGLLVEMDDGELKVNQRVAYRRDVTEINIHHANSHSDDCKCANGPGSMIDSILGADAQEEALVENGPAAHHCLTTHDMFR